MLESKGYLFPKLWTLVQFSSGDFYSFCHLLTWRLIFSSRCELCCQKVRLEHLENARKKGRRKKMPHFDVLYLLNLPEQLSLWTQDFTREKIRLQNSTWKGNTYPKTTVLRSAGCKCCRSEGVSQTVVTSEGKVQRSPSPVWSGSGDVAWSILWACLGERSV